MSEFQNYQNNDSSGLNSSGSDGDANGGSSQNKSEVGVPSLSEQSLNSTLNFSDLLVDFYRGDTLVGKACSSGKSCSG